MTRPTEVTDSEYIFEEDSKIAESYNGLEVDGEWIMFFSFSILDEKWNVACELYRARKLAGVHSMKVSTRKRREDVEHDSSAITFHCGPSSDKSAMIACGKNIVEKFNYSHPLGFIGYKTDAQIESNEAIGKLGRNYTYKIPVPFAIGDDDHWLVDHKPNYIKKYGEPDGFWTMYFLYSVMEEKWQLACDLFSKGELDGISFMRRKQKIASFDTGFIDFLCGPSNDRSLMLRYGQNLVHKLQYTNSTGNMKFEFDDTRTSLTGGYKIPVHLGSSDYVWHVEENLEYIHKYGEFDGSWVMNYKYSELEEKWNLACELFKKGELDGISCMKCPKKKNPSKDTGIMFLYCGPSSNKSLIMRYGRNLVDKLQYTSTLGYIRFVFDVLRTGKNGFYKISV